MDNKYNAPCFVLDLKRVTDFISNSAFFVVDGLLTDDFRLMYSSNCLLSPYCFYLKGLYIYFFSFVLFSFWIFSVWSLSRCLIFFLWPLWMATYKLLGQLYSQSTCSSMIRDMLMDTSQNKTKSYLINPLVKHYTNYAKWDFNVFSLCTGEKNCQLMQNNKAV